MDEMTYQAMTIMEHLKKHRSITSLEAIELYGCTRLSARVWDLRHIYDKKIKGERIRVKTRFGNEVTVTRYELMKEEEA